MIAAPPWRSARRLLLAAALTSASCDKDPTQASPPGAAFGSEVVEALCAMFVRCQVMPDRVTCLAKWTVDSDEAREVPTFVAKIAKGRMSYHPDIAARCLALLRDASCSRALLDLDTIEATCDSVFEGKVPAGGACHIDHECAQDGACINRSSCTSASCCPIGTCEPRPVTAPACETSRNCPRGQSCVGARCVPPPGPGQACNHGNCRNSVCHYTMQICTAPAPEGGACREASECDDWLASSCPPNRLCHRASGPGQPCAGTLACLPYLRCKDGTCQPRLGPEQPCESPGDCLAGSCRPAMTGAAPAAAMTCQLPPPDVVCDDLPAL